MKQVADWGRPKTSPETEPPWRPLARNLLMPQKILSVERESRAIFWLSLKLRKRRSRRNMRFL